MSNSVCDLDINKIDVYEDNSEYRVFQYIKKIESFISSYGYENKICNFNKENNSLSDIALSIKEFLVKEIGAQDYLEVYGTLKDVQDRTIYVCCYEPYGDELIFVEHIGKKLYFFDKSTYDGQIGVSHINYL